jgi:serine/threonine-protein kinase
MSATVPPKLSREGGLRIAQTVAVGALLDGKYRVEGILGRGGMAIVMAARHETLRQRVALKLLRPEAAESRQYAQRVLREARAAAALKSEHVTRVLDLGQLDSGEPYIVMELLEGSDLSAVLAERGPLPVVEVAAYLVQACDAIAEAHACGIVHRDLKPSNLFLTRRRDGSPLVKLMDFGISKVEGRPDESLTTSQDSLGTPHYMSPEQLLHTRDVDARSDVWALGVLAFRLLTGAYAFHGETMAAVHIAVVSAPIPRLRDVRPDAPPAIDDLIVRCLVRDRADRLQSVKEFASVLLPFVDEGTRQRYAHLREPLAQIAESRRAEAATATTEPITKATWGTDGEVQPRRGRAWIGVALATVVLASAGALVIAMQRRPAMPAPVVVAAPSELPSAPDLASAPPPTSAPGPASAPAIAGARSSAPTPSIPIHAPRVPHAPPSPKPARDPYGDRR